MWGAAASHNPAGPGRSSSFELQGLGHCGHWECEAQDGEPGAFLAVPLVPSGSVQCVEPELSRGRHGFQLSRTSCGLLISYGRKETAPEVILKP